MRMLTEGLPRYRYAEEKDKTMPLKHSIYTYTGNEIVFVGYRGHYIIYAVEMSLEGVPLDPIFGLGDMLLGREITDESLKLLLTRQAEVDEYVSLAIEENILRKPYELYFDKFHIGPIRGMRVTLEDKCDKFTPAFRVSLDKAKKRALWLSEHLDWDSIEDWLNRYQIAIKTAKDFGDTFHVEGAVFAELDCLSLSENPRVKDLYRKFMLCEQASYRAIMIDWSERNNGH